MMAEKYVGETGVLEKLDPLRDVYQEFPLAMMEVARVTVYGAATHAPRDWQAFEPVYGMNYHRAKLGRHLLALETEGPINSSDDGLLHAAQVAWNALAYLENYLKSEGGKDRSFDPEKTFVATS